MNVNVGIEALFSQRAGKLQHHQLHFYRALYRPRNAVGRLCVYVCLDDKSQIPLR